MPISYTYTCTATAISLSLVLSLGCSNSVPMMTKQGSRQIAPSDDVCKAAEFLSTEMAGLPVLLAVPHTVTASTPLVVMYHGFGAPNTPEALARELPPIRGAITVYPTLPLFGARMPTGGTDELVRRQQEDYIGLLLYPVMSGAAHELPKLVSSISESYRLSKTRPLILFGFSAGGAAALLSLTNGELSLSGLVVLNSPLSIDQAVESYERQVGHRYVWTQSAKEAALHYNIARDAERIVRSSPRTSILLLQSERDPGLSTSAARSVAEQLQLAAVENSSTSDIKAVVLPGVDHFALDPSNANANGSGTNPLFVQATITEWVTTHALKSGSGCS